MKIFSMKYIIIFVIMTLAVIVGLYAKQKIDEKKA